MNDPIIIQIHPTPELISVLKELIKSPGVSIRRKETSTFGDYLTLREAASEAKVNYQTFRCWVVEKKLIPFSRLGNSPKGDIRLQRSHVHDFITGKNKKKKRARKGGEVSII